jgi:dihydrodipicolinate synthase/N-acetylneuraminate lyase
MIHDILTPNLVPFKNDGPINEAKLRRILNLLIEKGVSGLSPTAAQAGSFG